MVSEAGRTFEQIKAVIAELAEAARAYRRADLEQEFAVLAQKLDFLEEQYKQDVHGAVAGYFEKEIKAKLKDIVDDRCAGRLREKNFEIEKLKGIVRELQKELAFLHEAFNRYYAFVWEIYPDKQEVDVMFNGSIVRVMVLPSVDLTALRKRDYVILNPTEMGGYCVTAVCRPQNIPGPDAYISSRQGEGFMVKQTSGLNEEYLAFPVPDIDAKLLDIGQRVQLDRFGVVIVDILPQSDSAEATVLKEEDIPDISFEDIGGLGKQKETIRDLLMLPYIYPEEHEEFKIAPPKGILLYGPPGCGKTMIAKAVANDLIKEIGRHTGKDTKGCFYNIRGPELLNKWVGETQFKIRSIFESAQKKAKQGVLSIIFFDEMDALFRLRGSGISSDIEINNVLQFTSMMDGLRALEGVVVIGATNRQDLIDPAVTRPGRLDIKIKVDRPDEQECREIFSKYLLPTLPFDPQYFDDKNYDDEGNYYPKETDSTTGEKKCRTDKDGRIIKFQLNKDPVKITEYLINEIVTIMYDPEKEENKFMKAIINRETKILYYKDFASGAMIENIVLRAKRMAFKRSSSGGSKGICKGDLVNALYAEFSENEDLPNTREALVHWAAMHGMTNVTVSNIEILDKKKRKQKQIENIEGGQYL